MNRRRALPALFALALPFAVVACGSDDEESATTDTPGPGASYEIVSDQAVAEGWATMLATMTQLSADPSSADEEALEEVHEMWESFEGTVKQNDPDSYLTAEEALDAFLSAGEDGDGVAMAEATAKMSTTSATYLAAHPG